MRCAESDAIAGPVALHVVSDLEHFADGQVPWIKWIFDPFVPVGAGIEEPVVDDVLGSGAHQRADGPNEHLARAGRSKREWLAADLLLAGEHQAVCAPGHVAPRVRV